MNQKAILDIKKPPKPIDRTSWMQLSVFFFLVGVIICYSSSLILVIVKVQMDPH